MNERADRWLAFALEDLHVAEVVLPEGVYNQVCFHAQQCVEKCLKSVLAHHGREVPRTHSLTDLVQLLPAEEFGGFGEDLAALDEYYIPTRYPDALRGILPEGLPGRSDAEGALALARRLSNRVTQLVRGTERREWLMDRSKPIDTSAHASEKMSDRAPLRRKPDSGRGDSPP